MIATRPSAFQAALDAAAEASEALSAAQQRLLAARLASDTARLDVAVSEARTTIGITGGNEKDRAARLLVALADDPAHQGLVRIAGRKAGAFADAQIAADAAERDYRLARETVRFLAGNGRPE